MTKLLVMALRALIAFCVVLQPMVIVGAGLKFLLTS